MQGQWVVQRIIFDLSGVYFCLSWVLAVGSFGSWLVSWFLKASEPSFGILVGRESGFCSLAGLCRKWIRRQLFRNLRVSRPRKYHFGFRIRARRFAIYFLFNIFRVNTTAIFHLTSWYQLCRFILYHISFERLLAYLLKLRFSTLLQILRMPLVSRLHQKLGRYSLWSRIASIIAFRSTLRSRSDYLCFTSCTIQDHRVLISWRVHRLIAYFNIVDQIGKVVLF